MILFFIKNLIRPEFQFKRAFWINFTFVKFKMQLKKGLLLGMKIASIQFK